MTNYTNTMANALAARRATRRGVGGFGKSFMRHSGSKSASEFLAGGSQRGKPTESSDNGRSTQLAGGGGLEGRGAVNPMHQWRMEKGTENKLRAGVEQTKTQTKSVLADIQNNAVKAALEVKKANAELPESKYKRTTKGIQNAASYASQLTQENYPSWFKWVSDTNFLPFDMFASPEEVSNYTPEKAAAYFNKIGTLVKPDPKVVKLAVKKHEQELKLKAKEAKLKTENKKLNLTNQRKDEKALIDRETQIIGKNGEYLIDKLGTAPYVEQYNRLAERLGTGNKYVWSDEDVIEVPGKIYGTNKVPGYIKVKVGEEVGEVGEEGEVKGIQDNTEEEIKAMNPGDTFIYQGQTYIKK